MTPNREEAICCGGGGGVIAIKDADPQPLCRVPIEDRSGE